MADAFFANKKKKKKPFKGFNANKIDVESVTPTVHVDAPAISIEETTTIQESSLWDEDALLAKTVAPVVVVIKEREILDVKTLSQTMSEQSDTIQQKLNLEETKAALQAAREGMEREAQRLKQQEQETTQQSTRFRTAAAQVDTTTTSSGKWVAPHLRSGGAGGGVTRRVTSNKLDTKDETLFPDLSTADKILEQEKKWEKTPKKTPVGGTWASARASGALKKQTVGVVAKDKDIQKQEEEEPENKPEEVQTPPKKEEEAAPTSSIPAPASEPPKTLPVKKKTKKKDVSTFKSTS